MPPFNGIQAGRRLLDAARTYHECFQYALIPVFGDAVPEKSKVAAIEWKKYQSQRPTDADFERWFLQDQLGGLAIVTGRLSGLVVLDFDDEDLSRQFAREYPHLADTRTVRTAGRGLPHHYFRLPPHLSIASQKAPGVDLQADGRYVVAPPTSLNGREYKVVTGGMPYTLVANDVRLLTKFLADVREKAALLKGQANEISNSASKIVPLYEAKRANQGLDGEISAVANPLDSYSKHVSRRGAIDHIPTTTPFSHQPDMSQATNILPPHGVDRVGEAIDTEVAAKSSILPPYEIRIGETITAAPIFVSAETLITQYRAQAQLIGRNQALFQQACQARDAGWTDAMTFAALAAPHIDFPAPPNHPQETPARRRQEAAATIRSVFSRPRRKPKSAQPQVQAASSSIGSHAQPEARPGLPGSLRETFLQMGQCHTLRVLDGLLLANIQPGTLLTEKMICEVLHNLVGRYSIRHALQATLPNGEFIFQRHPSTNANASTNTTPANAFSQSTTANPANPFSAISPPATPSPAPPTPTAVAAESVDSKNNNCVLFRVTISDKNNRGRRAQLFVMPSAAALCAALNLKYTGSDALAAGDVANPKQYRQKLHQAFLQRRPGQYSRKWLAQRLGVSVRSIQRYRQGSGISTKPVYHALPLAWYNLNQIPVGLPLGGMFLQSETGKRYPPLREIARALLAKKERVLLMRQDVNHYSVPPPIPMADQPRVAFADIAHLPEKDMLRHLHHLMKTHNDSANTMREKLAKNQIASNHFSASTLIAPNNSVVLAAANSPAESIIIPREVPKFVRRHRQLVAAAAPYTVQSRRYYGQPLPNADHERAAQQLYDTLRGQCPDKKGYLTLTKARRLSEEFGTMPIQQALTTLHTRHNIHNPAGFVVTFLRSTANK